MSLFLLLLAASFTLIASQTIVRTLPGYNGRLPFKLETGYIGVGEDEAVQLFYYFVESEGNPEVDPLIIWLAGGPGCSTLMAFFFEIGPLQIQYGNFIDDVPALQLDPNSWTKVANIIYLDAPARTGYSYTKTEEAARTSDTLSGSQTAEFIRKFLRDHPKFLNNPMYVTGISYSGIVIPMITEELYKGNDEGLEPIINIKGYVAGNPLTNKPGDINSRLEYAYRVALISEELFESTKRDCGGEYAEADSNNLLCMSRIDQVNQRVKDINIQQILEPNCDTSTNLVRSVNPIKRGNRRSLRANLMKMVHAQSSLEDTICPEYDDREYAILWANNKKVKKALNVREESVKEFSICNNYMQYNYGDTLLPLYDFNVLDSVVYHKKLSKRNSRALIFSGDHDMLVPHIGTYNWINSLNFTTTGNKWDAWYTNGQLAGYKTTYAHNNYSLAFATVKGGSHTAPVDKPVQCFEMIKRWFARESI